VRERPKALGAAGSAVGLSAIALGFGACCVAPWAVALLGVGGAVMLARLAVLQPYVVAVTLVLSGLAFWYAYRKQSAAAAASCPVASRRGLRVVVWIGALIVVIVDVASYVAPRLSSFR
jgi:MerT mercuric transport protein